MLRTSLRWAAASVVVTKIFATTACSPGDTFERAAANGDGGETGVAGGGASNHVGHAEMAGGHAGRASEGTDGDLGIGGRSLGDGGAVGSQGGAAGSYAGSGGVVGSQGGAAGSHAGSDDGGGAAGGGAGPGGAGHAGAAPSCGNGVLEAGEQCDGAALGGSTCTTLMGAGYGGALGCTAGCAFDKSACAPVATCGDGHIDPGEECDAGASNGATCALCSASCKIDCCDGQARLGDHCYDLYAGGDAKSSFASADSLCRAKGGYLVSFGESSESAFKDEYSFVYSYVSPYYPDVPSVWIGLKYNPNYDYKWSSGEVDTYTEWDAGLPPYDESGGTLCADLGTYDGTWSADECDESRYFVCEFPPAGTPAH